MNPWELLFAILGWIAVGIAVAGALILLFGVVYGIARATGAKWAADAAERNAKRDYDNDIIS